jgi:hypothetical protein
MAGKERGEDVGEDERVDGRGERAGSWLDEEPEEDRQRNVMLEEREREDRRQRKGKRKRQRKRRALWGEQQERGGHVGNTFHPLPSPRLTHGNKYEMKK